jgi:DNA-binding Lrp family transcriptional regulator
MYNLSQTQPEESKIQAPPRFLTRKSSQLLKMLWNNGTRHTVYSFYANQKDIARKWNVTRQALSIHFRRLRESGMVQIGRGFINVTEEGLRAIGYNSNPVIVMVRISPNKRLEVFPKIITLPVAEVFRVTGEVDLVLILDQDKLDQTLAMLASIDGVVETKSLVSI